jgi:hypothetical protein
VPSDRPIVATSRLCVSRECTWSSTGSGNTCVLSARRRNGPLNRMRSWSRWNGERALEAGSGRVVLARVGQEVPPVERAGQSGLR